MLEKTFEIQPQFISTHTWRTVSQVFFLTVIQ